MKIIIPDEFAILSNYYTIPLYDISLNLLRLTKLKEKNMLSILFIIKIGENFTLSKFFILKIN